MILSIIWKKYSRNSRWKSENLEKWENESIGTECFILIIEFKFEQKENQKIIKIKKFEDTYLKFYGNLNIL